MLETHYNIYNIKVDGRNYNYYHLHHYNNKNSNLILLTLLLLLNHSNVCLYNIMYMLAMSTVTKLSVVINLNKLIT